MFGIVTFIQIAAGIVTLLLILAHNPKSEGLGAIGASASQFSGVRTSADDQLDKITWTAAIIFILTSALLGLGYIKESVILKPSPEILNEKFVPQAKVLDQSGNELPIKIETK